MFQQIYDSVLTLAYPQICKICGRSVERFANGVVCDACWNRTHLFTGNETLCYKCQKFLSKNPSNLKTFCHQCDEHFYDLARAIGKYESALSASVLQLKQQPTLSQHLKLLFCDAFEESPFESIDSIIPVPLSKHRLLERGFNQATVLAKVLAKESGIKLNEQILFRTKHSKVHRAGMDKKGRELTVKNAFEVKGKAMIEGKNVLLVDDVFTSGATVSHCAKALKKSGANSVFVLTIARTA